MLGRSAGLTFKHELIKSLRPSEYGEVAGILYWAFITAMAIEPPCSVVWLVSKGEWLKARAKRRQPRDYGRAGVQRSYADKLNPQILTQISTFSSSVVPVLTSKSSGARYGIVLCSAATSYGVVYRVNFGSWFSRELSVLTCWIKA